MDGLNRVFLVGTLGADAELRETNGGPVLSFRVATTESWFDQNSQQRKEATEWHRCFMFGKHMPKLAQYMSKGTRVHCEGSLRTRSWDKDGQKQFVTEVRVSKVILLGSGDRRDNRQQQLPGSDDDDFPI